MKQRRFDASSRSPLGATESTKLEPRPGDIALSLDDLRAMAPFCELSQRAETRMSGAAGRNALVLRRYRPGDVICRQGAVGWTAFYAPRSSDLATLLGDAALPVGEGAVAQVSIDGVASAPPPVYTGGLLASLRELIAPRRLLPRTRTTSSRRTVPVDGPCDLDVDRPIALLHEGELFGEMSCLHYAPRSATVRALRDVYLLEFLGNVLELLLTGERFRAEVDAAYRERTLSDHLRAFESFAAAPPDVITLLKERSELVSIAAGTVLFEEGAPSDGMYVIRNGTMKVVSAAEGGRVLAYLSRGDVLGEIGLANGAPRTATCAAYEHPRDDRHRVDSRHLRSPRVELVRIGRDLYDEVCERFPAFRDEVQERARAREEERRQAATATARPIGRVDKLGLAQGERLLLIDLDQCTRCDACVSACADSRDDGVPRLKLDGPRFGKHLVPTSCRQCRDPVCLIGCPVGAIHRGATGEVVIERWCVGCGVCVAQCPYDAIQVHEEDSARRAMVCDQCASLDGVPRCVYACPHDAAHRVDGATFFSLARR